MNVELAFGKLSYRDVRTILALVDSWPAGSIHFESGGLVVDAVTARSDAHVSTDIASPAVGIFRAVGGDRVPADGCIGQIEAPQKSTPVLAASGARIVARLVSDGAFVEYGQPLVLVAP